MNPIRPPVAALSLLLITATVFDGVAAVVSMVLLAGLLRRSATAAALTAAKGFAVVRFADVMHPFAHQQLTRPPIARPASG